MRILVTVVMSAFALAGSASANDDNVALTSMGASIYAVNGVLGNFVPSNVIDGSLATEWVAPGGTVGPYLIINLGQLFTVDSITVDGVGNPGLTTSFSIYASNTVTELMDIADGDTPTIAPVLSVLNMADGTPWAISGLVSTSTPVQYILYLSANSPSGCPTNCFPGNANFVQGVPTFGQDDAFATEISADDPMLPTPEPAMIGLVGLSLLALGFVLRYRKARDCQELPD